VVTKPQAEDVLQIFLEGYSKCFFTDEECQRCEITIHFYAQDLTDGRVPITSISLTMNGKSLANLTGIASSYYEDTMYIDASCGQDVTVELRAVNSLGQEKSSSIYGNTSQGALQ
jgi:hypothetical protein